MSIQINNNICIGCGRCTQVCPGSLIGLNAEHKACISCPERCWGCASCLKECPVQAISLFLGEDIGGLGGNLTVKREGNLIHWKFTKSDGTTKIITVNSKDSNKY